MEAFCAPFIPVLIGFAFGFYLLLSLIFGWMHTPYGFAIWLVNFVFGWTILDWIAALIWVCTQTLLDPATENTITEPSAE